MAFWPRAPRSQHRPSPPQRLNLPQLRRPHTLRPKPTTPPPPSISVTLHSEPNRLLFSRRSIQEPGRPGRTVALRIRQCRTSRILSVEDRIRAQWHGDSEGARRAARRSVHAHRANRARVSRHLHAAHHFATILTGEGRVNNVIVKVIPHFSEAVTSNVITIDSMEKYDFEAKGSFFNVLQRRSREVLLVGKVLWSGSAERGSGNMLDRETDRSQKLALHRGQASKADPYRVYIRLPLANTGNPFDHRRPFRSRRPLRKLQRILEHFRDSFSVAISVPGPRRVRTGVRAQYCAGA